MRKRTVRRKVRRAKTRRGGAVGNNNDPSYNASSRMYGGPAPNVNMNPPSVSSRMNGGPAPFVNEPNASSRMYGGPAPIVNAVPNVPNAIQHSEAPTVPIANPAPNQNVNRTNAPIVKPAGLNHNKINANQAESDYMKSAGDKPEPFNIQHAMKLIQNMYLGLVGVGDGIKYATTRIAESTRDFILSIYEEDEKFRRENDELKRKYGIKDNNDDWEGEQPVTINYVCLCRPAGKGHKYIDVRGYLYLITTNTVYRSVIDIWTGDKKEYTPNPFQKIYHFEESDTVNNTRNNVLISYCKRNMLMVKQSDEPGGKGRSLEDIVKFCIKLESIFRVFYNPFSDSHEEAEDAYKMNRMISPHPGMSEKDSIAISLLEQQEKKP